MGLIQCFSVRAYWVAATCVEKIADYMVRNRFKKLSSHIHLVNNLTQEENNKDKLWKLQPWLDGLKESISKLPQDEHSVVDEVLIPFKGRSNCKQFMRIKLHKGGVRVPQVLFMNLRFIKGHPITQKIHQMHLH